MLSHDEELPVAFFSRQLHGTEFYYSATELKALVVCEAIWHFNSSDVVKTNLSRESDHSVQFFKQTSRIYYNILCLYVT